VGGWSHGGPGCSEEEAGTWLAKDKLKWLFAQQLRGCLVDENFWYKDHIKYLTIYRERFSVTN